MARSPRGAMPPPNRVHLLAHANPASKDVARFGFADVHAYLDFIRASLPAPLRITASPKLLTAVEDPENGGRRDDTARIRDIQGALDDPGTAAIVALAGGGWFSRILPHLNFDALRSRAVPLLACGFSEMTSFVNIVASYRGGRGLYWLCPNYLAWKISPPAEARAAFAEFWRRLPEQLGPRGAAGSRSVSEPAHFLPPVATPRLTMVRGAKPKEPTRWVGGCLSVLCTNLAGRLARRIRPRGAWVFLEDVNEAPYRIDRYLATMKLAGWFEVAAGVAIGDFHAEGRNQVDAVAKLLTHHVPRRTPIARLHSVGHLWPMHPVVLNRATKLL